MPTDRVIPLQRVRRPARSILATVLALILAAAVPGCAATARDQVRYPDGGITIASGSTAGVYYGYATEYARVLRQDLRGLKVKVVTTSGSVDNLIRLDGNTAQLGFATADTAYNATDSKATYPASKDLRAIARIYDEYLHLVVPANSKVRSIRDLHGLRVSTGAVKSSTEVTAGRTLEAVELDAERDLKRHRLGLDGSIQAFRNGQIDAFFWSGGLPTSGIKDLASRLPIRLVPLGEQVNWLRRHYGTYYRRAEVPSTTYPDVQQAVTVGVPNYLVVSGDLEERLVYELTRVLFQYRREIGAKVPSGRLLDARSAISTMPVQLHPGAERYYRDVKA